MKQIQCPNCHGFKIVNRTAKLWGSALLGFIFGAFLLPVFGLGLFFWLAGMIALMRLPFEHGLFDCKSCGWKGKRIELTNLQSNV